MSDKDIDPMQAVEYMIAKSGEYAQAKANRIYCDEYRKSLKSILMKEAMTHGHLAVNAQEREAYSSPKYIEHLHALKAAVEAEETLRYQLVSAQARIEVYRTQSANERAFEKAL